MTYYFISLDPDHFSAFQRRISFLAEGIWIEEKERLKEVLAGPERGAFFFIDLGKNQDEVNEWAILIRKSWKFSKLIFVGQAAGPHGLKEHQLSAAGGDAYVHWKVDEKLLHDIVKSLIPGVVGPAMNKLDASPSEPPEEESSSDIEDLKKVTTHPLSMAMDELFKDVFQLQDGVPRDVLDLPRAPLSTGAPMSDKDQELSFDDLGELDLGSLEGTASKDSPVDGELSLGPDEIPGLSELDLSPEIEMEQEFTGDGAVDSYGDISLADEGEDEGDVEMDFSLEEEEDVPGEKTIENLGMLDLQVDDIPVPSGEHIPDFDLGGGVEVEGGETGPSLSDDLGGIELDAGEDLSDDAKKKLMEIDAIMDDDASRINISESLVSEDLNLDSFDFSSSELPVAEEELREENKKEEEKPRKKKKEVLASEPLPRATSLEPGPGELERTQATIFNLRADRQELLTRIQQLEDEKMLQGRHSLTVRAELDERKIELSIVRKKLNEEIADLKDRMKVQEERKLILEEKNRILQQELDKAGQKNKIDVKKVQMRERELEQKLELLKSDAETQIRNRDLKILELKRKVDAMEFDMESISQQERKSMESRFELEDKLDKAIKTLRTAISVLEDESDRGNALDALKKNIDM